MSETLKFESKITKFEAVNPLFSKIKIKIAYAGLNRNNSFISKEAFEKALPSIYNCPIVGEFSQSVDDFRGHGGKIEVTDDEIKWVNTTMAYGVIDSDTEITWEDVEEEDGTVNSYFCATGYLWKGRFPEIEQVIENSKSQSMEIEIVSGKYTEIDGHKAYEISDFVFSGFCILGDDVEPCFESSEIVAYSLDKENFKQEFTKMVAELKFSLEQSTNEDSIKGGETMEKLTELLEKYNLTVEDLTAKEINHIEFTTLEELESKIIEVFTEKEEPKAEEFTLTSEQLEGELKRELAGIESITLWEDYSYPRFCFVDSMPEQGIVVAFDEKENILVGFNYSVANESVEVNAESAVRYKVEFVPMNLEGDSDSFSKHFTSLSQVDHKLKVKENELTKQFEDEKSVTQESIDKLTADFTKLQEDYSTLEASAKELETFKLTVENKEREDAETALFNSFSSDLTEDEMSLIKEKKSEFTLEEIEEKLFVLVGKKKAKLSFSKLPDEKPIRVTLPTEESQFSDKEYADLVEKHRNKK